MAGTIGNKNAIGNKGGKPYSAANRKKAAKIKGILLDEIEQILKNKKKENSEFRKQLILKLATTCFPQEVTGEDGQPIKIVFDNSFKENAIQKS